MFLNHAHVCDYHYQLLFFRMNLEMDLVSRGGKLVTAAGNPVKRSCLGEKMIFFINVKVDFALDGFHKALQTVTTAPMMVPCA